MLFDPEKYGRGRRRGVPAESVWFLAGRCGATPLTRPKTRPARQET
jgi:hypothetical protein